jgi:hypothetical protein
VLHNELFVAFGTCVLLLILFLILTVYNSVVVIKLKERTKYLERITKDLISESHSTRNALFDHVKNMDEYRIIANEAMKNTLNSVKGLISIVKEHSQSLSNLDIFHNKKEVDKPLETPIQTNKDDIPSEI